MSEDILDLDALNPVSKKIKINGKLIECKPITVKQLITIARLQTDLAEIKDPKEIFPYIKSVLSPFIPAINEDEELDFTVPQLIEIIKFAQSNAVPSNVDKAKDFVDSQKKK